MDVDALVVLVEERLEAFREGVARSRAVGGHNVGVVVGPGGQRGVRERRG